MRIVALGAHLQRIVFDRIDLRKSRRARRVVGVTHRAKLARLHDLGGRIPTRFCVCSRRAVAHFARDATMITKARDLHDVLVAIGALDAAGVLDRAAGDRIHRGRAIVAQVAKSGWNEKLARCNERAAHEAECNAQPQNLLIHDVST